MRSRFNEWVRGAIGIKESHPCPLVRGLVSGDQVWFKAAEIAEAAVAGCGGGSSKTYRVYLNEDVAGGFFIEENRKDQYWVSYSQSMIETIKASYLRPSHKNVDDNGSGTKGQVQG